MGIRLDHGVVAAGRYRLDARLGEGGMGTVWSAEDVSSGRRVALKFVREEISSADARQRLIREARAAAAIRHPNVVVVHEVVEVEDGTPVLVMEVLAGETLAEKLRRDKQLEVGEAAAVMLPVISAVGTAHALGIVHRDLKPENIFLSDAGVKVLDFGIAKLTAVEGAAAKTSALTATGTIVGTPYFMAPEQMLGEKQIDHRADVWSLGLILYQALSGILPTAADNAGQVMKLLLMRSIWPLSEASEGVPREVGAVVDRMLARKRQDRLSDLAEVREVLARYAEIDVPEFGASTVPVAVDAPAVDPFGATVAGPQSMPPDASDASIARAATVPEVKRNKRFGAAIAAAILVISGGVALFMGSKPKQPMAPPAPLLASRDSVLACPPLEATGVEEPSGWFGAAAAQLACRRALWILGGKLERVVGPAELLGLPREPTDDFPEDPFGEPTARQNARAAAAKRAHAILGGSIARVDGSFRVELALEDPSGRERGRAGSTGTRLLDVVDAALDELVKQGLLARQSDLDDDARRWLVSGVGAWGNDTLDIQDESLVGRTQRVCDAIYSGRSSLGLWESAEAGRCADFYPDWQELVPQGALDASTGATLALWSLVSDVKPQEVDRVISDLQKAREHERTRWEEFETSIALANLWEKKGNSEEAQAASVAAVSANPTDANNWLKLGAFAGSRRFTHASRARTAWVPWSALAWLKRAIQRVGDVDVRLRYARRAFALAPGSTSVEVTLGRALIDAKRPEEAHLIAIQMPTTLAPMKQARLYLLGLAAAAEGRFREAVDALRGAVLVNEVWVEQPGGVAGGAVARLVMIASLLGLSNSWADEAAQRYVIDASNLADEAFNFQSLLLFCVYAEPRLGRVCLDRVERDLSNQVGSADQTLLAGATRYVRGDHRGAAKVWRPLVSDPSRSVELLPVSVFDEANETDLAESVDRAIAGAPAYSFRGATPAHPRMAKRAFARGDNAEAKRLAEMVIAAWSDTDVKVPAVDEMHALLAKLR